MSDEYDFADAFDDAPAAPAPRREAKRPRSEAAAPDPEEQAPKRVRLIDWSQYPQPPDDPITDPTFNLFEYFAQTRDQLASNKKVARINDFMRTARSSMRPFDYCAEVQRLYNRDVRDNLMDPTNAKKRKRGPAWPAQQIYEYPIKVVRTAAAINEGVLHRLWEQFDVACDEAITCQPDADGVPQRHIDPRIGKLSIDLSKEIAKWTDRVAAMRNTEHVGGE